MLTGSNTDRGGFVRGLALTLATWGVYFCVLWSRMLFETKDGLYAGWRTVWADWSAHFAYANVFAYRPIGAWFSSHPVFAGANFDYPFLADALSGLLMRAGMDRIGAFLLPSVIVTLVFLVLLFVFYEQLLRSPKLAFLACTLFFTNGGLGFLKFARDLAKNPNLETLFLPPREYTWLAEFDIKWINIVSSELLPQRALLLGIPLGLMVLIVLRRYVASGFAGVSRAKLCALGALPAVLVITHMHSFLALVLLCGMLLLFDRRNYPQWLIFAGASALPSVILFTLLYSETGAGGFIGWYPGWLTNAAENSEISLWKFLTLNWGIFLPIAAVSMIRFRYYRDPLVLGGAVLFVLCFLFRFQPNLWDNTKLLTWSHLLLCVPVARYLAHLWSRPLLISRCTAVVLLLFTTASGSLDLWRMTRTDQVDVRMWSREEMELAEAFQEISSPTSLVLCSDYHHHWVPSLSGRRVMMGYRGWLASYGVDYKTVERDVRTMLGGGPDAESLIDRYGVDYVVIGSTEQRDFNANESYFEQRHELILEKAKYKVFAVDRKPRSDRP